MARILLVRHGDTDWNQAGRIQGQVDTSLSEKGLAQARALAGRLAQVPIDVAYASDLNRAAETAQEILIGRAVTLGLAPELREFSYGAWEGLTYRDVQRLYPAATLLRMLRSAGFRARSESLDDSHALFVAAMP